MKLEDIAYIAGILDGEGSILLTKHHKGQLPSPVVSIASTDKELLDWLKETIGKGSISTKKVYQKHHKQSWDYKLTFNAALSLLEEVYPYLKIERKRQRARLLLDEYKTVTPRDGKYTEEMKEAKLAFVDKFRAI